MQAWTGNSKGQTTNAAMSYAAVFGARTTIHVEVCLQQANQYSTALQLSYILDGAAPVATGVTLTTSANGTGQAAFTITGLAPGSHNVVVQVNNPAPAPGSCYYINAAANPNATSGIPVITTT